MAEIEEPKKPRKSIMDIVSLVDFFSTQTSFSFEGEENYKTVCGGLASLLIILICLVVTVTDSKYQRNSIKLAEVLDESSGILTSQNFGIGITVKDALNGSVVPLDLYWKVEFNCVKYAANGTLASTVPIGIVRGCELGDYCMDPAGSCQTYVLPSTENQYSVFQITSCNPSTNSSCVSSLITSLYGRTSPRTYQIQIKYRRFKPSSAEPTFESSIQSSILPFSFSVNSLSTVTLRRNTFLTNPKFQGALGFPSQNIMRFNFDDKYLPSASVNIVNTVTTAMTNFRLSMKGDIRLLQYTQQFVDISGMLSAYFALSGIIIVLYSIAFSHYSQNMLNLSIAQHLHYMTGPNRKLIEFNESSLKVVITCMVYFPSIKCIYPKCLHPYIAMIEAGKKKLNLNHMLEDLIQISAHDTSKNPLIRLKVDVEDEEEKEEETDLPAKLADHLRTTVGQANISGRQTQIFTQWVQLNNYTLDQAKAIAGRIYMKNQPGFDYFAQKELRQYNKFRESLKETDYDELFLVNSNLQNSDVALQKSLKEDTPTLLIDPVKDKEIKIKGDNGKRETLIVNQQKI